MNIIGIVLKQTTCPRLWKEIAPDSRLRKKLCRRARTKASCTTSTVRSTIGVATNADGKNARAMHDTDDNDSNNNSDDYDDDDDDDHDDDDDDDDDDDIVLT